MSEQVVVLASVLLAFSAAARAEEKKVTFDNKDAIAAWTVTGDVAIDAAKTREGANGGSLKLGPGGRAIWKLSDADLSGKVEFWVYEDGTVAAQPKQHGYGALWGVMSKDGKALVSGAIYASYLGGGETYATGEFNPSKAGEMPSYKCQYLGSKRTVGWHKWTFDMDPEKGLTLFLDDKDVNKPLARFDWNKTELNGIAAVVFSGDGAKDGKQVLWVNSLSVAQGGLMKAKPTPPPPPPPIVPEKDPASEAPPVKFLDTAAGKHPRLLITAERIPQLRAFYNSDEGKMYREQLLAYLPGCVVPADRKTTHAWGQEVGLFSMPMVALHYVLTGDKNSFARAMEYLKWLDSITDWSEGGSELNSDHAASFTMVGASLMWDWLYNDLEAGFREKFRQDLWYHARYMYYGGHLGGNSGGNYWRGVPAYNHRWFRDWGLTLAALAAAEGKPEEQWLLDKVQKELKFMVDWLPADGSQHEGPSYGSSAGGLGMACQVSDECLGTHYLDAPFFKSVGAYALQMAAPGMTEALYFSDNFTKARSIHPYFLKTAAYYQQADVMDGIRQLLKVNAKAFGVRDYAWLSLIAEDPNLKGGQYTRLPTTTFFADLGIAVMRENWQDRAVAAMFKCGPMGGYKLNSYRPTMKEANGSLPYINVAHDQPDANSFILLGDGEYLAETDRYPLNPGKLSTGHNTILINGIGQAAQGRPEGQDWQQPGSGDMTQMARITAYKDAGDVVIAEGEAAGSYLAYTDAQTKKSRPALDRFRRTFIWIKGGYVLALDDVRAPKAVEVTWLMQGAKLEPVDEAQGRYRLSKNQAQCEFQLVADAPFKTKMGISTANDHSKLLGWQQLQASAETGAIRFASVYDPWHKKDLKVVLTPEGPDKATVTVTGPGIADTWQWQAATGGKKFEAATLHGSRKGGFDVVVDGKTAAPPAP